VTLCLEAFGREKEILIIAVYTVNVKYSLILFSNYGCAFE
jgi:hypothetical protein